MAEAVKKSRRRWLLWLAGAGLLVAIGSMASIRLFPAPASKTALKPANKPDRPLGVTALGRLLPAGDVRRLAAPSGAMGTTPRVSVLHVDVGDQVQAGALLASFDSKIDAQADLALARASISSLRERQRLLRVELSRYRKLQQQGVVSLEGLESASKRR